MYHLKRCDVRPCTNLSCKHWDASSDLLQRQEALHRTMNNLVSYFELVKIRMLHTTRYNFKRRHMEYCTTLNLELELVDTNTLHAIFSGSRLFLRIVLSFQIRWQLNLTPITLSSYLESLRQEWEGGNFRSWGGKICYFRVDLQFNFGRMNTL